MKKFLAALLLMAGFTPYAFAADAATVKIKISGAIQSNKYFLCLPEVGCLSIHKANQGKTYPIFRPIDVRGVFVLNSNNFQLFKQKLPASCQVKVDQKQTITISGTLKERANQVEINRLRCSVS